MGHLLSIITFLPLAGAAALLCVPEKEGNLRIFRWGSLCIAVLTFLVSLLMFVGYRSDAGLQHLIHIKWIPQIGASYIMGVDGMSLWLVLLNTLLFPLAILISFGSINKREKLYYVLLLLLETAVSGVFFAQDLLLFYFFWEAVLIPMYFIIGIWGSKNRIYATTKFVLYTLVGSFLMLAAIIGVWSYSVNASLSRLGTFDMRELVGMKIGLGSPTGELFALWCFLAFFLAFAIKVPLFPFHTWLPDAHTEAPTAGSIILAGVLLKMGTYGFMRFAFPLFPDAAVYPLGGMDLPITVRDIVMALSVIGIIYGALVAAVQVDVKRLVAYSSVAHLGFVMLGLFSFNQQAIDGAIFQMVAHGISTGGLFMLVGFLYDRRHTRLIEEFGGLARVMPVYYNIFLIIMLSSVGLPGLNGFVGEFLILIGSFQENWLMTVIATLGVILAAVYLLYMFRRVFFGKVLKEENSKLIDLAPRELIAIVPLVLLAFVMGLFPGFMLSKVTPSSEAVVSRLEEAVERSENRLAGIEEDVEDEKRHRRRIPGASTSVMDTFSEEGGEE